MVVPLNTWYEGVLEPRDGKEARLVLRTLRAGEPIVVTFVAGGFSGDVDAAFEAAKNEWPDVIFMRVDVTRCPETRAHFNIVSVPTAIVAVQRVQNNLPQKIESLPGADVVTLPQMIRSTLASGQMDAHIAGMSSPSSAASSSSSSSSEGWF
jgi:hypothetical protein